jgi:hypothetical protein
MTTTQSGRAAEQKQAQKKTPGRRAARRAAAAVATAHAVPGLTRPEPHYRFVAPHRSRNVAVFVLLASIVVALLGGFVAVTKHSTSATVVVGTAAVIAVMLWGTLMVWSPQVVTVDFSVIVIKRGHHVERFDLVDPNVDMRVVDGEIAFTHYDGRWVSVLAADVDWKEFTNVVMFYQNHADRKAVERTENWGR